MTNIIIGADISKNHIELHRQQDGNWQHADYDKGGAATLEWMGAVERIIYELTGNSYRAFDFFMLSRSLAVSILRVRRDGLPMLLVASQNWGQNKSSPKSYAKDERNENLRGVP